MISYNNDSEKFKTVLSEMTSTTFTEYLTQAVKTKKKLNYADELPRYTLLDAHITENTLTLCFDGNVTREINFSEVYISQSGTVEKEFYINSNMNKGEYFVIIFNC